MPETGSDMPTLTLVIRTEEGRNLSYVVELEGSTTTTFYCGENFKQASYVADKIFSWLKQNDQKFAVYKEEPNGQGASYFLSTDFQDFPLEIEQDESFFSSICEEFESEKLGRAQDINGLFRDLVEKYKLNEYQEQRLLKLLKQLGYV